MRGSRAFWRWPLPPALAGQMARTHRLRPPARFLADVHDTARPRAPAPSITGTTRHHDPAGLVALRRAELGADPDAGDARGALRTLVRRSPDWPVAWHLLALAEVRRAAWERSDSLALGNRVGTGALEHALDNERRALEADPRFLPAALGLADLALGLHDTAFYAGARRARRADHGAARRPESYWREAGSSARRIRRLGWPCSSGRQPRRTRPPGTARLGTRTAPSWAPPEASGLYYAAADTDDLAVAAGHRADLAPIALTRSRIASTGVWRGACRG